MNMKEIKYYGLTPNQYVIGCKCINENLRSFGQYKIKEVTDREMVNVWIADAHSEGNEDYAEFLRNALAKDAELYTLVDTLGEFEQEIGELAVFY
jgi:hypothetical protein